MFSSRQCVCEKKIPRRERIGQGRREEEKKCAQKTKGAYPLAMCPSNKDIETHREISNYDYPYSRFFFFCSL